MKKLKNLILGLVMAVTLSACNSASKMPTPTAIPVTTAAPTLQATQKVETRAVNTETSYIGNVKSKKFHRPDCHTLPSKKTALYCQAVMKR